MRKSTTHRDRNRLGEWSIILSLKLASMSHSCPYMSGQCDMTTPLYRARVVAKGAGHPGVQSQWVGTTWFRRLLQKDSCFEHEQVRHVLKSFV